MATNARAGRTLLATFVMPTMGSSSWSHPLQVVLMALLCVRRLWNSEYIHRARAAGCSSCPQDATLPGHGRVLSSSGQALGCDNDDNGAVHLKPPQLPPSNLQVPPWQAIWARRRASTTEMLSRMQSLLSWAEIVGDESAEAGQPARRALGTGGEAAVDLKPEGRRWRAGALQNTRSQPLISDQTARL